MARPGDLSRSEFEALPVSVQRKYFSSVERLRITEQERPTTRRSLISISPPTQGSGSLAFLNKLRKEGRLRRLSVPGSVCNFTPLLSSDEARWFLSLPEKVRRAQFSREEQIELTKGCAILFVDGVIAYEFRKPIANPGDIYAQNPDLDESWDSDKCAGDEDSDRGRDSFQLERKPRSPVYNIDECSRRLRKQEVLHKFNLRTHRRTYTASSGVSIRSTFLPFPPNHVRKHSVDSDNTGSAVHYQDPETRKKLRKYLSNPQKLDEAIEFGFPQSGKTFFDDNDTTASIRSVSKLPVKRSGARSGDIFVSSREVSSNMQEPTSFFVSSENSSVRTINHTFMHSTHGSKSSIERVERQQPVADDRIPRGRSGGSHVPASLRPIIERVLHTSLDPQQSTREQLSADTAAWDSLVSDDREMTLRVTLTRSDLRSSDEEIYGYQHSISSRSNRSAGSSPNSSPTSRSSELEQIEDPSGMNGVFAIQAQAREQEQNRDIVRRIAKKIRR